MTEDAVRPVVGVAVTSARESVKRLYATVAAAEAALNGAGVIDVLVNGNPELAGQFLQLLRRNAPSSAEASRTRLWLIPLGDKAHTINEYVRVIWPGSAMAVFCDGYAAMDPNAVTKLCDALESNAAALAATGLPSSGRSSRQLSREALVHGGIHGNLFAVRGNVMQEMRRRTIHLPLGLYRVDALIGAFLSFNLNPAGEVWDSGRIEMVPDARWSAPVLRWWKPRDILVHWRRLQRQAQGDLENRAYRHHLAVLRRPPEALPMTARELVRWWVGICPGEASELLRSSRLRRQALRLLDEPRDWSLAASAPELLFGSVST